MFGFVFRLASRIVGFAVKTAIFAGVLVVAAGGVMYALFDGEQYKRALSQRVVDVTGRTLTVNGPAELHLTLPPRLVLNDVRIGNPRWASRREMASIRRL